MNNIKRQELGGRTRLAVAGSWLAALIVTPAHGQPPAPSTNVTLAAAEATYFEDLPVVLSATRLRQTLADAPAAVTIIDRDFIRRSGARDINELFRLVPGFQVGGDNGAHPLLYYHGVFDEWQRRLQVLVDGRSMYLPFILGEVEWNTIAVAIEDIERIEVIRGSNAASYGDVAFHGMVNIITRHAAAARGVSVAANVGDDGIQDGYARLGWGDSNASYRFTVKDQRDRGLAWSFDDRRMSMANFRADLTATQRDEITVLAGVSHATAGQGYVDDHPTNPAHTQHFDSNSLQVDWQRDLGRDASTRFSVSHEDHVYNDATTYAIPGNPIFDFGSRASRDTINAQHTFSPHVDWRVVWGGQGQWDRVESRALDQPGENHVNRLQGFVNAEWRTSSWLLVNVGGLEEHDNLSGNRFAPRLAANFQFSDAQVIRAGVSKAFRAPSITEMQGNVRLWYGDGSTLTVGRGNPSQRAEWLQTSELSYLGDFPKANLRLDARAFRERISSLMRLEDNLATGVAEVRNGQGLSLKGFEYQADWRPRAGTRLLLAQTFLSIDSQYLDEVWAAPRYNTSIGWFQNLPGDIDLTLTRYNWGSMTWQGVHSVLAPQVRCDLRVAHAFSVATTRGEVALVVQNLGHDFPDFVPAFRYQRRAFLNLRLDL